MKRPVRFLLNGQPAEPVVDPERRLLWVLRTELELTGTKHGCGQGLCGSCTVLVDGRAQRSCRLRVSAVEGREVTTIEGLADGEQLHPVQAAFIEHGAFQCGFCTSGMIVNAAGLLNEDPRPSRARIERGMEGNLCRCGAHPRILKAVETAAAATQEEGR
ncbi:MAG: (2Fe-2S)-binding protein [Planctomycetes bacterium]|nr:(2Fe-2S)-binding protein [Planctomycetota bacterium]